MQGFDIDFSGPTCVISNTFKENSNADESENLWKSL